MKKAFTAVSLVICFLVCSVLSAQQPGATPRQPAAGAPGALAGQPGQPATAPAAAPLGSPKQKGSYGLGMMVGSDLAQSYHLAAGDIDFGSLVRGVADALNGAKPAITEEELKSSVSGLIAQVGEREFAKVKASPEWQALADKNKKAGEAYLAANKGKEGVKTLPDGLQYKVLKQGSGATPGPNDAVVANYKGTLTDNTVFDSSAAHGGPATFPVSNVIKGWVEALQKMKVGDKWQLVIPSELAYGERGSGETIGPNSTLVFEIELLDVQKGGQQPESLQPGSK